MRVFHALALSAALLLTAGDPPPADRTFAVRCKQLHTGGGEVLTDAVMIVVEGRIEAVGSGADAPAVPEGMAVLDVSDKVVMPGIVLADSDLSNHGDAPHNVTPDFVALDGFDFAREYRRALSGGVCTVYLSPGRNRLVSGQGSVVKLHGGDLVQRVLAESACLRMNMGTPATRAPVLFEPTPEPTADDPLLPARQQLPTARISVLPTLRQLFADARAMEAAAGGEAGLGANGHTNGAHGGEDRYSAEALHRAARGALPLRVAVTEAADARRALDLARSLGAGLVLEDPRELRPVVAAAAAQGAAAVLRVPVRPGHSNPGGEDREAETEPADPRRAVDAAAAGMRIALAPAAGADLSDMLLIAGIAIRHGLPESAAMRALTADAAAILGVGARVGTLEKGKDADFLVLSGEPFAIGTMVEKTFVDGEPAFEREVSSDVLAVRAGKILTMADRSYRNGVLIVQDGKIKAVGEDLAIPYGARVLELDGGVMVPGFVDAYSHLGLSGEGSGIPAGAADQRVAGVVQHDDPLFRAALEAGLTTVLVSGTDGSTVSGRVAALKTGARDREHMVLKETAAIRFVHDGIGPEATKALAEALERGKKYVEAWRKDEKAIADWKAGKRATKPGEAKEQPKDAAADPLTGTWELELGDTPFPGQLSLTLELALSGTTVTGTAAIEFGGRGARDAEIENGKFENGTLTAEVELMGRATLTATVGNDEMTGRLENERFPLEFTGKRVAKPGGAADGAAKAGEAEDGEPKKPVVDESLEPLRALLEQRIPAVIRADRAPAIASAVAWCEAEKLPYVLTGLKDAIDTPELLGSAPNAAVVLGPDVVRRDGAALTNAAALLSDRGHPVALGTGDTAGARYLPLHAALAVRYGMDPTEALKAMTIHAARMFKLDDRIGSLERGKDADFVVFSGSPFEMTSRVELVVVNGEVVVDRSATEAKR